MSGPDARARLAEQQARLVGALVAGGEHPEGFAPERLRLAAGSLRNKRVREVVRAWPELAACLGEEFAERFLAYAADHPPPAEGGPLADGRSFARTLAPGEWTDEARLAVLGVDLHHRRSAGGLRRRRGLALRGAWLRRARVLVLGVRLPWLGVYWLRVPLGRAPGLPGAM
jgi:hypothetical protein